MKPIYKIISKSHAILLEDYEVNDIVIPKNYVWDGISLNRLVFIRKFGGKSDAASLEHDWCYVHEGVLETMTLTRKQTDKNLKNNLIKDGIWKIHANYIYVLVRVFGWFLWRKNN
jgi:hypothetical protein